MGVIYSQASFKNSRISARKPTTEAITGEVPVSTGPGNTLIRAANSLRTYLTIRNTNQTSGEDLRYDYFDNPNMLTEGMILRASEGADLESPETVYARAVSVAVTVDFDEGQG